MVGTTCSGSRSGTRDGTDRLLRQDRSSSASTSTSDADELEILDDGGTAAEVSDLTEPENVYERSVRPAARGLHPGRDPGAASRCCSRPTSPTTTCHRPQRGGARPFRPITDRRPAASSSRSPCRWCGCSPAGSTRPPPSRERLLLAAVDASDAERRRIARDLHDGVVQDLAGTSFALSASRPRPAPTARDRQPARGARPAVCGTACARCARCWSRSIRRTCTPRAWRAALDDLVAPASPAGMDVELHVADTSGRLARRSWRWCGGSAQEAVRNALRHGAPAADRRADQTRPDGGCPAGGRRRRCRLRRAPAAAARTPGTARHCTTSSATRWDAWTSTPRPGAGHECSLEVPA